MPCDILRYHFLMLHAALYKNIVSSNISDIITKSETLTQNTIEFLKKFQDNNPPEEKTSDVENLLTEIEELYKETHISSIKQISLSLIKCILGIFFGIIGIFPGLFLTVCSFFAADRNKRFTIAWVPLSMVIGSIEGGRLPQQWFESKEDAAMVTALSYIKKYTKDISARQDFKRLLKSRLNDLEKAFQKKSTVLQPFLKNITALKDFNDFKALDSFFKNSKRFKEFFKHPDNKAYDNFFKKFGALNEFKNFLEGPEDFEKFFNAPEADNRFATLKDFFEKLDALKKFFGNPEDFTGFKNFLNILYLQENKVEYIMKLKPATFQVKPMTGFLGNHLWIEIKVPNTPAKENPVIELGDPTPGGKFADYTVKREVKKATALDMLIEHQWMKKQESIQNIKSLKFWSPYKIGEFDCNSYGDQLLFATKQRVNSKLTRFKGTEEQWTVSKFFQPMSDTLPITKQDITLYAGNFSTPNSEDKTDEVIQTIPLVVDCTDGTQIYINYDRIENQKDSDQEGWYFYPKGDMNKQKNGCSTFFNANNALSQIPKKRKTSDSVKHLKDIISATEFSSCLTKLNSL